jgi:hypothetical protein
MVCCGLPSGSYGCIPLGDTCCKGVNAVTDGLYCPANLACYDTKQCMDYNMKLSPASTPLPGTSTAGSVIPSVTRTVNGGGAATTTATGGGGGGSVVRTTGPTITGDGTPTSASATGSQAAAKSSAAAAANLHDLYARVVFAGAVPVAGMMMM